MAGCLYNCLKEAHLEGYHPQFVHHGIVKCDGLAVLSMQDYSRFGITRMEDRVRLFKLIQIVKSVQAEGRYCKHPSLPCTVNGTSVDSHPLQGTVIQTNQPCTRGQAFVQYMRSKPVLRGPGYGVLNEVQEVRVMTKQDVPIIRPSRSSSSQQFKPPQRSKSVDVVKYRPETGSPIFKCRKVLTFSDSESDDDDEIPDRDIRQKVLSTMGKMNDKNTNWQGSDQQKVAPPQSFYVNIGDNMLGCNTNKDKQNSVKGNSPQESLFGAPQNLNQAFQKGQITSRTEFGYFDVNLGKTPDSGLGNNNKRNILRKEIVDRGNVSEELLNVKRNVKSDVPSDISEEPQERRESSIDEETDEYFDLPGPSKQKVDASSGQRSNLDCLQNYQVPLEGEGKQSVISNENRETGKPLEHGSPKQPSARQYNALKYSPDKQENASQLQFSKTGESQVNPLSIPIKTGLLNPMSSRESDWAVPRSAFMKELWPPGLNHAQQKDRAGRMVEHAYFPRTLPSSPPVREPVVERVLHNTEYNYGVPGAPSTPGSRKKGHKAAMDTQRIRVCVRKRPLTRREQKRQEVDIVNVDGQDMITVDETKVAIDLAKFIQQHVFVFDEVFSERCSNEDVYNSTAKPLVRHIFNRGSATCFAFGQTGAGKTYTLMGTSSVPGLYRLAANDMFSLLKSGHYGANLHLWLSYYEIYCGQLYDLLNKRKKLHVRENGRQRVCVAGLMETRARNVDDVVQVVQYGNSIRSTGNTGVNPNSSRSHAILQLEVRDSNDQRLGRISFIDLAGSERAADVTEFDRQTRLEGAEINQSLLALKECIRSLDQESKHTPYRQSKLTHILRDSFIGNSRTCMIANISPSLSACENTLNTLRYADRVKELRRNPTSNQSPPSGTPATPSKQAVNPSLFHPSNIQLSSTPKVKDSSQEVRVDLMEGLQDPGETPIRGHKLQRSTEERKSRDMIPHAKTHSTGSPSKVSPFEFNIEKTGGIISITTSGRGKEPRPCRSRENSSERTRRKSSIGSKGSPQRESLRSSQQGTATPKSANTTRTSKSYRSKKSSESSINGVNENSPTSDGYNNKSNNSSHKEGDRQSYPEAMTEMTGIQGGKVTQPVVIRGRLSSQEFSYAVDSQQRMRTSIHAARQALASSSKTQQQMGRKPTVVDEHRQILSHLDNIMDRAKAVINKSSDGSDLSSPSPQHRLALRQQSQNPIADPSSDSYKLSSAQESLERLRTIADRPGSGSGCRSRHQAQMEEDGFAQRSHLYDLQREREALLTGASEHLAEQKFLPLQEDLESIDQMEAVNYDRPDNMPDGHHFSPQQEGEDDEEGHFDTENEDVSSGDEESSESSGDSSPFTEEEDLCSCAENKQENKVPVKGPGQLTEAEKDYELCDQQDRQHLLTKALSHSAQPDVPVSEAHRVSDSLEATWKSKSQSMHDITPHVEKIRDLLSSDVTNGNCQTGRDVERVPRLSLVQMEAFQNTCRASLNEEDKNHVRGNRAISYREGGGEVQILPQAEGFLKSLAGMKVSKKMLEEKVERPSPKSAFTVNPALTRLAQTFCPHDNHPLQEAMDSAHVVRGSSSLPALQRQTTRFVQGNQASSLDYLNVETRLDYGSDARSISDSGFGTRHDTTEQDSLPPSRRTLEENDSENEMVSEASTMDGVTSLSAHLDELQSALKPKVLRMPQEADQALWKQMDSGRGAVGKSDGTDVEFSTVSTAESRPVFVPIHPYPVSDSNRVVAPTVITKGVPKLQGLYYGDHTEPWVASSITAGEPSVTQTNNNETNMEESALDSGNEGGTGTPRSVASVSSARSTGSAIQRAQSLLLEAHEDQLAEITTLCKYEMRLLMAVKLGEKTYSDYVEQLEELLSSKAAAISTLRAQLAEFTVHSAANTPRS